MSATEFSIHDVLFRRTGDDECAIVVFGENVGTVVRLRDRDDPSDAWRYIVRLLRDPAGARRLARRSQIRRAAADMLWDRGLVPVARPAAA